ncbi:DegT/DnrJ/EryC1/StrS family aminotransferase [Acetivibrio ethanolgignens]|uniref:Aminotransferase DegT n=1 Tax=Acetivibrio ethanolgignens TaxID=290052 RepID=A0A0V8QF11_9FIRM|nr:DegT/DnrJ/EryC1/StrS family aminotransferase [Acetivibrio ethanolgignens]KSV58822.1 aminotransferase DegT [Acetivibrio ethanolgignens]
MQFRDLKTQYQTLKPEIDQAVIKVMEESNFISGTQVTELEVQLASYVGAKHCITCANGTDALTLALMAWNVGVGDAVFVPDFTFFASGETVAYEGATPIFVDIEEDSFNMSPTSLEQAIEIVLKEGKLTPKVIVAVDLFGQPADYVAIRKLADKYGLYILEDGAQGFGGRILIDGTEHRACSFGDISTTSFFPAKPLGCYGDGGAIFTDNDTWADLLRSLRIHGKGSDKYDNVGIGMNSRLDTIQAAILQVKLKAFEDYELEDVNKAAAIYTRELSGKKELEGLVKVPAVKESFYSSWAQYSILLNSEEERDGLQAYLKEKGIPTMVYYPKPMHEQTAFAGMDCVKVDLSVSAGLCKRVLALPLHPYLKEEEQKQIVEAVKSFF